MTRKFKIDKIDKINRNLTAQAQAIYQSWFVDFEPWGGTKPIEWKITRLDEEFDVAIGKTPPRKEPQWFTFNPQDVIWFSISDMGGDNVYLTRSSEYLTHDAIKRFNIKTIPANTVLLSFKLTVGRVAITTNKCCTNEAIAHFKTSDRSIVEYLYCSLKNYNYQQLGSTSSIATAVNSKMVKAIEIMIPPKEIIQQFHSLVNPMFEQIKQNVLQINLLSSLRDALLPRLMSGELDVSSLEI